MKIRLHNLVHLVGDAEVADTRVLPDYVWIPESGVGQVVLIRVYKRRSSRNPDESNIYYEVSASRANLVETDTPVKGGG